jgi:hypothetical protein
MQRDLPLHLQHEPRFALPYFEIDGPYAGKTDAHFLTVGIAQWDRKSISAKVMRYSDHAERWIRSSEELPVHRVLDLAKVIAVASQYRHGTSMKVLGVPTMLEAVSEIGASSVAEHLRTDPEVQKRLHELADCLVSLGYGGKR